MYAMLNAIRLGAISDPRKAAAALRDLQQREKAAEERARKELGDG